MLHNEIEYQYATNDKFSFGKYAEIFGYKKDTDITYFDFLGLFNRGIGKRLVNILGNRVWSKMPTITSEASPSLSNDFDAFAQRVSLQSAMATAERLAKIGRYATLLIGTSGELHEPAESIRSFNDIVYVLPKSSTDLSILSYNMDSSDPRYGMPETYEMEMELSTKEGMVGFEKKVVHASRVHHVCYSELGQRVVGEGYLLPVYNYFIDLIKVVGGGCHSLWLNVRNIFFNTKDGVNLPKGEKLEELKKALSQDFDQFEEGLRRVMMLQNFDAQTLNLPIPNIDNHFNVLCKLIAGTYGIPLRVLFGSETGERTGLLEKKQFERVIKDYRTFFSEPVFRGLMTTFLSMGLYKGVDTDMSISWGNITDLSDEEMLDINSKKTAMLVAYVNANGADDFIPPEIFLKKMLLFSDQEIEEIMKGVQDDAD